MADDALNSTQVNNPPSKQQQELRVSTSSVHPTHQLFFLDGVITLPHLVQVFEMQLHQPLHLATTAHKLLAAHFKKKDMSMMNCWQQNTLTWTTPHSPCATFLGLFFWVRGWVHYIKLVRPGNRETEDVPLVELMYPVFTCMPGELL